MKISCIDKEIHEILSSGFYKIPRFQRPYSWQREQIEDFWNDTVTENPSEYFIGSIVVFKSDRDEFGVVDGQQRLTTITMLLSAVRNALKLENLIDLAEGVQTYIEKPNRDNRIRFILDTETSYPYLQEKIQKNSEPAVTTYEIGSEEKNLEASFKILTQKVNESVAVIKKDPSKSDTSKKNAIKQKLTNIRDKILELKLIIIELDNEDDAYIAFETLNTRGKDLTVSDLVKNHLTKLVRNDNAKVDIAKDNWTKVIETIEGSEASINADSFLHHFWLSKYEYTSIKQLFKLLKKKIKTSKAASELLANLLIDAETYREIHEKGYRKWEKSEASLQHSLDALLIFGVKQPLPMMLAVLREYKVRNIRIKHARESLKAIENFHFSFTAITSQRSSGGISFMYAKAARELTKANSPEGKVNVLKDLQRKLKERKPSYAEFEANFLEVYYSDQFTKRKHLVQYILANITTHHSSGVIINNEQMTIEHLAPQNPVNGKLAGEAIAQLGNLLFVDEEMNNKLANKDFQAKKEVLLDSYVWCDENIKNAREWNVTEIENRTKELARISYENIWKL